jgi:SnoaL-like domain
MPRRTGMTAVWRTLTTTDAPGQSIPAGSIFLLVMRGERVNGAADRDADIRARIEEHWEASERGDVDAEHAIYADDAILDYPQSGERFRGRSRIQAQRGGHPAERHFTIRRILGGGDLWVSECVITYDGVPTHTVSVMEITDGLVTHETQYFADPFDAPPGRAALAEPIPAR